MTRLKARPAGGGALMALASLLALAASVHLVTSWHRVEVAHASAAKQQQHAPSKQFDGIVLATYHKTGTAFASCLLDAIAWHLGMHQGHNTTSLKFESNLSSSALAYYLDLAKSSAHQSHGPAAKPPYLFLSVDDMPTEEVCFDTATMYFDAQVRWHNGDDPGHICPLPCPCHAGVTDCMGIGSCHMNNAHARLFWVHVIQEPLDAVLMTYHHHMKRSQPEAHDQWMDEVTAQQHAKVLAAQGLPKWLLESLRLPQQVNVSLWRHLQSLPEDQGVLLEYLLLSSRLWRMARLYQQAQRLNRSTIVLRREELEADPVAAVVRLLEASGLSRGEQANETATYVCRRCSSLVKRSHLDILALFNGSARLPAGLGRLGSVREVDEEEDDHGHLRRPRGPRYMRRERQFIGKEQMFEVVCRLTKLLGYTDGNTACDRHAMSIIYT